MQPLLERAAVEEVYRKHGHVVLRRACALLRSEAEALEAVQEVFLALLERPSQFEQRSSIVTWLYSATTHFCLNRIRNHKTRERILVASGTPVSVVSNEGEHRVELRELLERLPEELSTAAVYHFLDELTQDEIAVMMGCSRRHVGHLIERVRAAAQNVEEAV